MRISSTFFLSRLSAVLVSLLAAFGLSSCQMTNGLVSSVTGTGISIPSLPKKTTSSYRSPKDDLKVPRSGRMNVRTTAYTHTESDHLQYGKKTALGTQLRCGKINSAASDWSRFPVGTTFKIEGSDKLYVVDDYGGALVGTNTIDLYCPSKASMNKWGAKHVNIRILKWGSYSKSLKIMRERMHAKHVRRMVESLRNRVRA